MRHAILALLAFSAFLAAPPKGKSPRLDLRAIPKAGPPPLDVHLIADLVGGNDLEEWYCPAIVWNWGAEEETTTREPECAPFTPETKIDREFTADHRYSEVGPHLVTVTLRHKGEPLAARTASIRVFPRNRLSIVTDKPGEPRPH